MDRVNKKRARGESDEKASKRGKKKIETVQVDPFLVDESDIFKIAASSETTTASLHHHQQQQRPLSIFEFPWQKENLVAEADHGCDLRDVFFSSLVDGCKAAIGFPGDRLSPSPAPISLPDETDGVDCIWSCALREPLSLRCVQ